MQGYYLSDEDLAKLTSKFRRIWHQAERDLDSLKEKLLDFEPFEPVLMVSYNRRKVVDGLYLIRNRKDLWEYSNLVESGELEMKKGYFVPKDFKLTVSEKIRKI